MHLENYTYSRVDYVGRVGSLLNDATGLKLEAQVSSMAYSTFYHLSLACQLWPFLEAHELAIVIYAMVKAKLDCCNTFYIGLSLKICSEISVGSKCGC